MATKAPCRGCDSRSGNTHQHPRRKRTFQRAHDRKVKRYVTGNLPSAPDFRCNDCISLVRKAIRVLAKDGPARYCYGCHNEEPESFPGNHVSLGVDRRVSYSDSSYGSASDRFVDDR